MSPTATGVSGPMVGFRAGGGALNGQSLPTSLEVLRSSFRSAGNDSPSLASRSRPQRLRSGRVSEAVKVTRRRRGEGVRRVTICWRQQFPLTLPSAFRAPRQRMAHDPEVVRSGAREVFGRPLPGLRRLPVAGWAVLSSWRATWAEEKPMADTDQRKHRELLSFSESSPLPDGGH